MSSVADRLQENFNKSTLEYIVIIYSVAPKGLVSNGYGVLHSRLIHHPSNSIISACVYSIKSCVACVSRSLLTALQCYITLPSACRTCDFHLNAMRVLRSLTAQPSVKKCTSQKGRLLMYTIRITWHQKCRMKAETRYKVEEIEYVRPHPYL